MSAIGQPEDLQSTTLDSHTFGGGASAPCGTRFVCHCFRMTEAKLVETIVSQRVRSLEQLRRCSEAGDGCTACHSRLREIVERYAFPGSSSALPIFSAR